MYQKSRSSLTIIGLKKKLQASEDTLAEERRKWCVACEKDNQRMFATRTEITNLKARVKALTKSDADFMEKYEEAKLHRERVEVLEDNYSEVQATVEPLIIDLGWFQYYGVAHWLCSLWHLGKLVTARAMSNVSPMLRLRFTLTRALAIAQLMNRRRMGCTKQKITMTTSPCLLWTWSPRC
ncbi:hypothetical protein Hanom_Chr11g01038521 [Helianthus anomalus]